MLQQQAEIETFKRLVWIRFSTTTNGTDTVTERMRIENNGRVGIGTTAPSNPLHVSAGGTDGGGVAGFTEVVARFRQATATSHSAVSIDAPSGQDSILYLSETGIAKWGIRRDDGTGNLQIRSHLNGTNDTHLSIKTSGKIGMGTGSRGTDAGSGRQSDFYRDPSE